MAKSKGATDKGTETAVEMTVKVKHYRPKNGHGRMHMRLAGATCEWEDAQTGTRGEIYIPLGGANPIVTVRSIDGEDRPDHFTFDAESMIAAAVAQYKAVRS